MGFSTEEPGNNFSFSSSADFPEMCGTFKPPFDSASVSITAGPPACVIMAMFFPLSSGFIKTDATLIRSSRP